MLIAEKLEKLSTLKKIASNSAMVFLSTAILKAVMLITSIFIARSLGAEGFGKYGMVLATINTVMIFAGMGLGMTATKYIAEFKSKDSLIASKILTMIEVVSLAGSGLFSLMLFFGSDFISSKILESPDIKPILQLGCLLLFANTVVGVKQSIIYGFEDYKGLAISNAITALFTLIALSAAALTKDLNNVVLALGATYVFDLVLKQLLCTKLMKKYRLNYNINFRSQLSLIPNFCLPALLNGACYMPALFYAKSVLVRHDSGFGEVAKFDASYQWLTMVMILTGSICNVIFPMLAKEKDHVNFKEIYIYGLLSSLSIPLLALILTAPFSNNIMSIYGAEFASSGYMLTLALLISLLYSAWSLMSKVTIIENKMWLVFGGNVLWTLVVFISAEPLIEEFGSAGLLYCILLAWFTSCCLFSVLNAHYFIINKPQSVCKNPKGMP